MKHMATFVLITFLLFYIFFPKKIALFLLFRLFMMPELIGEFIFFHLQLEKSFVGLRSVGNIPSQLPSLPEMVL